MFLKISQNSLENTKAGVSLRYFKNTSFADTFGPMLLLFTTSLMLSWILHKKTFVDCCFISLRIFFFFLNTYHLTSDFMILKIFCITLLGRSPYLVVSHWVPQPVFRKLPNLDMALITSYFLVKTVLINPLSANSRKCLNTLKQFVGNRFRRRFDQRLSDVFRGYGKRTLTWNRLKNAL